MTPEPSKYFVDSNGFLCLPMDTEKGVKFIFQVVGVYGYQIPDKKNHNLGFMVERYQKQIKK